MAQATPTLGRPPGRRGEETAERILDAAEALFAEKGFDGTTLRDVIAPGFAPGEDYFDHFMPLLEYTDPGGSDPAYWADGRTRRFSNDALGLWQSECYRKGGATCLTRPVLRAS